MRRKKLCISLILAAVLLILAAFGIKYALDSRVDRMVQEIYALPMDTTAADLERAGYINLTDIQPRKIAAVSKFLGNDTASNRPVLKTFVETEDGTFIRLFRCNKDNMRVVQVTNYCVQGQYEQSPNLSFHLMPDYVEHDGITEVWLRDGAHHWDADPKASDFLLYRFVSE